MRGRFSAFSYKDQNSESALTIWYFCFARKTGIIQVVSELLGNDDSVKGPPLSSYHNRGSVDHKQQRSTEFVGGDSWVPHHELFRSWVPFYVIFVLEKARLLNNHILITDNMAMLILVCASASISAKITRCWYSCFLVVFNFNQIFGGVFSLTFNLADYSRLRVIHKSAGRQCL